MINPFKTRKILIINPFRIITIKIPFIGKIQYLIKKETDSIRGEVYNGVIIDEVVNKCAKLDMKFKKRK